MASETLHFDFDRHRIAYRVMGRGPALVVLSLYRRREDMVQVRLLRDRWQVFQIALSATAPASAPQRRWRAQWFPPLRTG